MEASNQISFWRVGRRRCPHCRKNLSLKTYKTHKRLYFDGSNGTWTGQGTENHDVIGDASDMPMEDETSSSPPQSEAGSNIDDPDIMQLSPPMCQSDSDFSDLEQVDSSSSEDSPDEDYDSEVWIDDNADDDEFVREESPPLDDCAPESENQVISKHLNMWLVKFLVHFQSLFRITDMAMECILKFLSAFFVVLARFSPICSYIADSFPHSLRKLTSRNATRPLFHKYVACRKCHSIFPLKSCIVGHGTNQKSKECPFQAFPNHPHRRRRERCGHKLLKTVELASGNKLFYPFMTYCYLGLETSLIPLFQRPNFHKLIEHWRCRTSGTILHDVYDGKVWSDFQCYNNDPFLSEPLSLGFVMNIDWFQPYKHVAYSVGAIYLVILNLPRHLRYRKENILLIGILPGPHEPSHDVNSYLEPLVQELLRLWKGVLFSVHGYSSQKQVRGALLCASCDIPAGRKVCGFIGHAGQMGCSKCMKSFPGTVGNMNYGGFDRENWHCRTDRAHRETARKLLRCKTKSRRQKLESESGYRYTVLLKLPYFNCSRMLIVDPMHNLFLGSAKHVLKNIWLEKNVINTEDFKLIQERIDKCMIPSDIGRIPHKINSGFASFTADQFKNWVIYFSVISLHGIVEGEELECWRHYVLACRILLQHEISMEQVSLADALLLHFCRRMERIHGSASVTPNMHLHCHLKACVLDYGPLHAFWCFPFERYNGLLGNIPNNNRSIEVQLMNRFVRDRMLESLPTPDAFTDEFSDLIPHSNRVVGSLLDNEQNIMTTEQNALSFATYGAHVAVILPNVYTRYLFTSEEAVQLQQLYSKLYSGSEIAREISRACRKYRTIQVNGKQLGCFNSRSSNSSTVMAIWNHQLFGTSNSASENRPVRIQYFAEHALHINGRNHCHIFASVLWHKKHCNSNLLGKPITLWECDLFESGNHDLIPIELVVCRTVSLVDTVDQSGSHALIICPCVNF